MSGRPVRVYITGRVRTFSYNRKFPVTRKKGFPDIPESLMV